MSEVVATYSAIRTDAIESCAVVAGSQDQCENCCNILHQINLNTEIVPYKYRHCWNG